MPAMSPTLLPLFLYVLYVVVMPSLIEVLLATGVILPGYNGVHVEPSLADGLGDL